MDIGTVMVRGLSATVLWLCAGKYIVVVGSETMSLILVHIFYVLGLREFRDYWHRHLKVSWLRVQT